MWVNGLDEQCLEELAQRSAAAEYRQQKSRNMKRTWTLCWRSQFSWVTFHVSSPLVCQCLSAEWPSMYQVLWSASVCQPSHLPCIKYCGLSAESPSMYQVLWSASVCQLSYLPCIKYCGLPVSVSWATFHVSSTLVWQFLSAELPSMYQVLWSASVCQLSYLPCIKYCGLPAEVPSMNQVLWSDSFCQLSYLPWIKSFGLTVSVSWATFHVSSPLVWQFLSAELPSMNQVLLSDSFCQLSYLPWINKSFGLTVSVSWATFHESTSPLVW